MHGSGFKGTLKSKSDEVFFNSESILFGERMLVITYLPTFTISL